jgi:hypothetical protein
MGAISINAPGRGLQSVTPLQTRMALGKMRFFTRYEKSGCNTLKSVRNPHECWTCNAVTL